jgi:hypothetical protein
MSLPFTHLRFSVDWLISWLVGEMVKIEVKFGQRWSWQWRWRMDGRREGLCHALARRRVCAPKRDAAKPPHVDLREVRLAHFRGAELQGGRGRVKGQRANL